MTHITITGNGRRSCKTLESRRYTREYFKTHPKPWVSRGRDRIDEEHRFECSECGQMTLACSGSSPDEVDPDGSMCDWCWVAVSGEMG